MNECTEREIKDLLPSYAELGSAGPEADRIARHLARCEDCRTELALLHAVIAEPIPDPGDAFWQSLQDRVYREVSVRREEPASSFRTALQHLFAPRWTWAASTALVLLTAAVLLFRPAHQTTPVTTAAGDQPAYGAQIASDNDDMDVTVLGTHELRTLSAWADSELAAITSDNTLVATTGSAMDIDDELAGLTAGQLQRLSKMLEAKKQEGRT
jgi:hypothetical protein